MNSFRSLALLGCAATLSACGTAAVRDISAPAPSSAVWFYNAGLNAPGVNFYANTTKLTAISSATLTESSSGTSYGSAAAGGYYTGVAAGQYTLAARAAADTTHPIVAQVQTNLAGGQQYSMFMSGPYDATAKTTDAFIVADSLPANPDYSSSYVRVVNTIYNAGPLTVTLTNTDTTVTPRTTALGTAVAYKSAGTFAKVLPGNYTLSASYSGMPSTVSIPGASNGSFTAGHYYTIVARGDVTVTGSTAANRPLLDPRQNR